MMRLRIPALAAIAVLATACPLFADDISGSSQFLCTAVQASGCSADGQCHTGPPWSLNVPQFIEVDLKAKELRTTKASGENRKTPIRNLERDGPMIILQGYEKGRAFSIMIDEETGDLSAAVARDEVGVSVFGSCTPIPGGQADSKSKRP
jgi:hypothetical protein